MARAQPFTMLMYEEEKRFIEESTLKYPNIETGGDLFGLWRNEREVVVTLVTGPGRDCRRTTTAFFQDRHYLSDVGNYLTSAKGLCNIGEWHSHHSLNLPEPSYGDRSTVWRNMPGTGLKRFLLIIATIKPQPRSSMPQNRRAEINGFMFTAPANGSVRGEMFDAKSMFLPGPNPYRGQSEVVAKLEEGAEMSVVRNEASSLYVSAKEVEARRKREKKERKRAEKEDKAREKGKMKKTKEKNKKTSRSKFWGRVGFSKSAEYSRIPHNGGTLQNANDFVSYTGCDTTLPHQRNRGTPFFYQDNPSGSVKNLAGQQTRSQNTHNVTVVHCTPRSDQETQERSYEQRVVRHNPPHSQPSRARIQASYVKTTSL